MCCRQSWNPRSATCRHALGREGVALDPPWVQLRERQSVIRRSLNPVQPVFAFLGDPRLAMSDTLAVAVGNVINVPVEIVGFRHQRDGVSAGGPSVASTPLPRLCWRFLGPTVLC